MNGSRFPVKRAERGLNPFRTMRGFFGLRSDLDTIFDELLERPFFTQPALVRGFPTIDVAETENEVMVKAELPGIDPKNIDVNVSEDNLEIKGEVKEEREEGSQEVGYCRKERFIGTFERTVPLPAKVKQDEVRAQYTNGVLKITMPKLEPSRPKARKVDIEVG
ncbi:MAG TPA: Hsp20/alpha crystallin family protein [Atribacteraceae bacterium]|nr:Hsp20/alpha crystallin family protein [Atribacteraceae bacterium]